MRLKIDKSFVKDTDKLNDPKIKQKIALCIDRQAQNIGRKFIHKDG